MSRPIPNASKGYDGLQMQITGSNTMSGWTDAMLNPTLAGLASMWDNKTATRPPWLPANGWWCYTDGAGLKRVFIFDGQRDVEIFRITEAGALTIASVSVATTALAGIVRMATIAETTNMSLSNVAVTPQGLNNLTSSEARPGLVEKATDAEVVAGMDNVRFVSPKGLQALSSTTAQKGIVQLSSAVDSTSEALAATPKAVKTAYDLANTANNKPTTTVVNSWTDASTTKAGAVGLSKWLKDNMLDKPTAATWKFVTAGMTDGTGKASTLPAGGTYAFIHLGPTLAVIADLYPASSIGIVAGGLTWCEALYGFYPSAATLSSHNFTFQGLLWKIA